MSHNDLVRRAYAAIYRSGAELPGVMTGRVAEAKGRQYVVISGGHKDAVLAVYRVRNDGMLKGLRRWPRELEDQRNEHSGAGGRTGRRGLPAGPAGRRP
jgi:hypothetical protein